MIFIHFIFQKILPYINYLQLQQILLTLIRSREFYILSNIVCYIEYLKPIIVSF